MLIGWLGIGLSADTGKLKKDAQSGRAILSSFKEDVQKIGGQIEGLWTKYLGFEAVKATLSGFSGTIRDTMGGIGETFSKAAAIGVATDELGKLQYAAQQSGVDVNQFTVAFGKLPGRIAQATMGMGPAVQALGLLGLKAGDLAKLRPEQQWMAISDAMSKVSDNGQKMSVAWSFFEEEGANLLPMINLGRDGLKKYGDEAVRFGAALNTIDSAQVAEANAAFSRLATSIQGVLNKIAVELSPYITAAANQFAEWVASATEGGGLVAAAMGWVVDGVSYVADAVQGTQAIWHTFSGYVNGIAASIVGSFEWVGVSIGAAIANWIQRGKWFGENFTNLMRDAANIVVSVFTNMTANIRSLFSAIWEYVKNPTKGFQMPDFKNVLEGFQATISEQPVMIQPRLEEGGWMEQVRQGLLKNADDAFAKANEPIQNSWGAGIKAWLSGIDKAVNDGSKKLAGDRINRQGVGIGGMMAPMSGQDFKFSGAMESNGEGAFDAVVRNAFGGSNQVLQGINDSGKKTAENTNAIASKMGEVASALNKLVGGPVAGLSIDALAGMG